MDHTPAPSGSGPSGRSEASDPFEQLAQIIIAAAAGRRIVYVPNPGNFGDGLIRYATKAFFSDYRIPHTEINIGYKRGSLALLPFLLRPAKHYFVYGGGGAWCNAYAFGRDTVALIARFTRDYLVLPSTYELGLRDPAGLLFRRDEGASRATVPSSRFCHDMALYLARRPIAYRAPQHGPTSNFFRTDRESARRTLPADNVDVSTLGNHMSNGDAFLAHVAGSGTINTDRLHVAIAGALVGARVNLAPGNYFKIRAIYDASLARFFPEAISLCEPG